MEERAFSDTKIKIINVSLSKKIIDILNINYSTELKFFKDKYKFKINLVHNTEFLTQEFLFSFFDSKKKLISEFNGTEVKEPSLKETFESPVKKDVVDSSEKKEETIDKKKHDDYKVKRKKFFNKSRFKENKRPKKKESEAIKEVN